MKNINQIFQPNWKFIAIEILLITPICLICVLLFASIGRPIWIDEFLHFTFASFDTTSSAWNAITPTLSNINHGQTGIYMLVNYWLLNIFGAEILALRAPSLISAFLLCYFSAIFLRIRGHGLAWQIFAIFIMFCQVELMYFAGEARPYMPLATASVGTLLYYLASAKQRSLTSVRFIGWFSVLLGVLIHPYFSIYWFAMAAFGLWVAWFNQDIRLTPRNIIEYVNIPLCITGSVIYFALASQTWLTGSPVFDRDPFQYMHRNELFYLFIWQHTTFLGPTRGGEKLLFVALIFLLIFAFLPLKIKNIFRSAVPPIILIYLALSLSSILSLLSYYQNYWILTRQWVASIALVAVGFSWLCAELTVILGKALSDRNYRSANFVFLISLVIFCWEVSFPKTKALWSDLTKYLNTVAISTHNGSPDKISCPISPDTWVEMANKNLAEGTPVWKIFRFYYSSAGNPYCED